MKLEEKASSLWRKPTQMINPCCVKIRQYLSFISVTVISGRHEGLKPTSPQIDAKDTFKNCDFRSTCVNLNELCSSRQYQAECWKYTNYTANWGGRMYTLATLLNITSVILYARLNSTWISAWFQRIWWKSEHKLQFLYDFCHVCFIATAQYFLITL
jgi:hypothetical protein